MKLRLITLLLMLSLALGNSSFAASKIHCPKSIASIQDNKLSVEVTPLMKSVYEELGCPNTKFEILPSRRALLSFNHGYVDGEVFRIRTAEKSYNFNFVRSSTPIISLGGSLWKRETAISLPNDIIAYQLGVLWHENYIKDKKSVSLHTSKEIVNIYNSGKINKFLGTNYWVSQMIKANELQPIPIKDKEIVKLEVFHYLNATFTPFMALFSQYIQKNKPFAEFSK